VIDDLREFGGLLGEKMYLVQMSRPTARGSRLLEALQSSGQPNSAAEVTLH
jgi:hypothetical protein